MKTSIEGKVFRLIISIAFAAVIILGIVSISGMWFLRAKTEGISGGQGEAAADESGMALESQMLSNLLSLASEKAALCDAKLSYIESCVEILADDVTDKYAQSGSFPPNPVPPINPQNKGELAPQLQISADFNTVKAEADLLGNSQQLLLSMVEKNDNILAGYIATESGIFITVDDISDRKDRLFDPTEQLWFVKAKEAGGLVWTDSYTDAFGGEDAIACAMPFNDERGNFMGVAGVSMRIDDLRAVASGAGVDEAGASFIITEAGEVAVSSNITLFGGNLLDNPSTKNIAEKMIARNRDVELIKIGDESYFVAYAPLSAVPWSVGAATIAKEAAMPAKFIRQEIDATTKEAVKQIDHIIYVIIFLFALGLAALILIITGISRKYSKSMLGPIDLERERQSAEMDVAKTIQASMLPSVFPPFPEHNEFDIYAEAIPAKAVGGDFYDFFFVGGEELTLAFLIADVSGKGVSAALFMAEAKTLIKSTAQSGESPKGTFERVNNLLCTNNDAGMFVTVFMGFLDIYSGKLIYASAGHNPPLLKRRAGAFEYLEEAKAARGIVLGAIEGTKYKQTETVFEAGDILLLYTDGVTEAVNKNNELFSKERLLDCVNLSRSDLKGLLQGIKADIDKFSDSAAQADDITMLVIKKNI